MEYSREYESSTIVDDEGVSRYLTLPRRHFILSLPSPMLWKATEGCGLYSEATLFFAQLSHIEWHDWFTQFSMNNYE